MSVQVSFSWSEADPQPRVGGYVVYYDTTNHGTNEATIVANATKQPVGRANSAVISGLDYDETYYLWVRWEIESLNLNGAFQSPKVISTGVESVNGIATGSPFTITNGEIDFATGNGLAVSASKAVVDLASNSGIEFSGGKLRAKTTGVIERLAAGLNLKIDPDTPLMEESGSLKFEVVGDEQVVTYEETNLAKNRFVCEVGTGAGIYIGFVNITGIDDHVKELSMWFLTVDPPSGTGNGEHALPTSGLIYPTRNTNLLKPGDFDLSGNIPDNRVDNSDDTANMIIAFKQITAGATVKFWLRGKADSAPDTLSAEARFIRFPI